MHKEFIYLLFCRFKKHECHTERYYISNPLLKKKYFKFISGGNISVHLL